MEGALVMENTIQNGSSKRRSSVPVDIWERQRSTQRSGTCPRISRQPGWGVEAEKWAASIAERVRRGVRPVEDGFSETIWGIMAVHRRGGPSRSSRELRCPLFAHPLTVTLCPQQERD